MFAGLKDTIFSVSLPQLHTPFGLGEVIPWNEVLHDPGNNYNPETGAYTAPIDGFYLIAFIGRTPPPSGYSIHITLNINGKRRYFCGASEPNNFAQTSCTWPVLLRKGQIVQIEVIQSAQIIRAQFTDGSFQSVFSGYLLFPV